MDTEHLNRRGRPKGSKNRLSEEFLSKLADDFSEHGEGVIQKVRVDEPAAYLKICASMITKELLVGAGNEHGELSDEEMQGRVKTIDVMLAGMGLKLVRVTDGPPILEANPGYRVIEGQPVTIIHTGVPRANDPDPELAAKFPAIAGHFSHSNPTPSVEYYSQPIDRDEENDPLE